MVIFFGAIIFSIIEDTYQYPTYENLIWFALFAIMVLVGIRVFYMAFKKKLRVANYNWPYGLYFDSEAMLIATESYFTLVPRQSVYLQQKRDINYDRYNGRIVYAIRYHGVWDFGADLGGLSDSVIQKFDQWVATGDKFSFYL